MDGIHKVAVYTLCSILLFRVLRYISTPLLRKIGLYRYYTPMFFTVPSGRGKREIHIGTSYDFFHLSEVNPKLLLWHMAAGLGELALDLERQTDKLPYTVQGTVFYFNDKTLSRFGFTSRKLNCFQSMFFAVMVIEHCILQSLSKRKLSIVRIKDARIVEISPQDLIRNKELFLSMSRRLSSDPVPAPSKENFEGASLIS
jgi:hypothetical protein